jgi:hypothetical protein
MDQKARYCPFNGAFMAGRLGWNSDPGSAAGRLEAFVTSLGPPEHGLPGDLSRKRVS